MQGLKFNIALNFVLRGFGMSITYISIPFILKGLGNEGFGLWMTMFSTIAILNIFDLGVSNSVKANLSKLLAKAEGDNPRRFISNSYFISFLNFIGLSLVITILFWVVDIPGFFNLNSEGQGQEFSVALAVLLVMVAFNFIARLICDVYIAVQKAWVSSLVELIGHCGFLAVILIAYHWHNLSLLLLAIAGEACRLLVYIIFTIKFFAKERELRPSLKLIEYSWARSVINIGFGFLGVQLLISFLYNKDNFLLLKFLGPEEVTLYSLVFKLFNVFIVVLGLFSLPLWSRYALEHAKGNFTWIRASLKKVRYVVVLLAILGTGAAFMAQPLLRLWTGQDYYIPVQLTMSLLLMLISRLLLDTYSLYYYSINRIGFQVKVFLGLNVINIIMPIILLSSGHGSHVLPLIFALSSIPVIVYWIIKVEKELAAGVGNR